MSNKSNLTIPATVGFISGAISGILFSSRNETTVPTRGAQGSRGFDGPPGPQGPPGVDGASKILQNTGTGLTGAISLIVDNPTNYEAKSLTYDNINRKEEPEETGSTGPYHIKDDTTSAKHVFNSTLLGPEIGTCLSSSNKVIIGNHDNSIGTNLSYDSNNYSIAIGSFSGQTGQNQSSVAIGNLSGFENQSHNSIAIGENSGKNNQGVNTQNGNTGGSIAIGNYSGFENQQSFTIAIGEDSGRSNQGQYSISIGLNSGEYNQGITSSVFGTEGGSIAIGTEAGYTGQVSGSIAIGLFSGRTNQSGENIAIGTEAGFFNQGGNTGFSVAIGFFAGRTDQQDYSVAIGSYSGQTGQQNYSTSVGYLSGGDNQSARCVALGFGAGKEHQPSSTMCLGYNTRITPEDDSEDKILTNLSIRCKTAQDEDTYPSTLSGFTGDDRFDGFFGYSVSDFNTAGLTEFGSSGVNGVSTSLPKYYNPAGSTTAPPDQWARDIAEHYFGPQFINNDTNPFGFYKVKFQNFGKQFIGLIPVINVIEVSS